MARAYGGQYSPKPKDGKTPVKAPAPRNPFRNRRARNVNIFARLLFAAPLPLLFAAFGSIGRGAAVDALIEPLQHEQWTPVELVEMDVDHLDATAATLARVQPDIVFNATSLQSWRIITELPPAVFAELDEAQFGPWLPMHLAPMLSLMRAVRAAGCRALVVNAAFPDAVNACLATQGLAPTTGIGNVANLIPALRLSVAHVLGRRSPLGVSVLFYAQHYLTHGMPRTGTAGGARFHLRAVVDRQDVTAQLDLDEVFRHVGTTFRRQGGRPGQLLTAGSAIRLLRALATDSGAVVHVPGPQGLPGGWAVRADASGVEPIIPQDTTREALIAVNEQGQALDGIDAITPDGVVRFRAENMAVMERMMGWRLEEMRVTEAAEVAAALGDCYQAFARRFR